MAGVHTIPDFLQWGEEGLEPPHWLKYWGLNQGLVKGWREIEEILEKL